MKPVLLNVPNINQLAWGAINGCEAASLLAGLHYRQRALDMSYGQFLLTMPISRDGNPYRGFGGSPFKNQPDKFEAIFSRPLLDWGRQFGPMIDLSGASIDWLFESVRHGNPVLTYVTVHFAPPQWQNYWFGRVPVNNHAVLLDGLCDDQVHVSDPIDGKYWLSKKTFETSYNARQMAVLLTK